jgi:excisionase family DNA binding protein
MPRNTKKTPARPAKARQTASSRATAAAAAPEQVGIAATMYITLDEAARLTGVSRSFLEREIASGRLPAIRDVALKVHRNDLDAWRGAPVSEPVEQRKRPARAAGAGATAA